MWEKLTPVLKFPEVTVFQKQCKKALENEKRWNDVRIIMYV